MIFQLCHSVGPSTISRANVIGIPAGDHLSAPAPSNGRLHTDLNFPPLPPMPPLPPLSLPPPAIQLISSSFHCCHSTIRPNIIIHSHGDSFFDLDALKCPCPDVQYRCELSCHCRRRVIGRGWQAMIVIYFEIQLSLLNTPFPSITVDQFNYSKLPHRSELLSSI